MLQDSPSSPEIELLPIATSQSVKVDSNQDRASEIAQNSFQITHFPKQMRRDVNQIEKGDALLQDINDISVDDDQDDDHIDGDYSHSKPSRLSEFIRFLTGFFSAVESNQDSVHLVPNSPSRSGDVEDIEFANDDVATNSNLKANASATVKEPTTASKIAGLTPLFMMIAANFFLSIMALCVRVTKDSGMTAFQLIFARSFVSLVFVVTVILKTGQSLLGPEKSRKYLISRGVFGFFSVTGYYYSIRLMNLSDAVVVAFLIPPFTAIGAAFVLKEKFSFVDGMTTVASLIGVILVVRPTFLFGSDESDEPADSASDENNNDSNSGSNNNQETEWSADFQRLMGAICGVGSAIFASGAYISIRKAGKEAAVWVLTGYFSAVGVFGAAIMGLVLNESWGIPESFSEWGALVGVSLASLFAQLFINASLRSEKAGLASSMNYTQMIFAVLWETTILHIAPAPLSLLGGFIIIICASVNIYLKYSRPPAV
eukprot:TRINITY_DN10006_c0_g1_i1.p1 TRINITY_DN10006_c0_g1~~TRINITY_DN10006_c0_g1_i1.p1  ORF type:complete len:486 (-),score=116.52 TRINITY_DN10006_c0_g1_i1:369-1826(-)